MLFGVTPGLGKGVAALGIYDDANRSFSNTTGPAPGHDLRALTFEEKLGVGGCIPCGVDVNNNTVCCSALAAGYKKTTYDAGDVRFGQAWVDPLTKRMTWFAWAGAAYLQTTVRDMFYDTVLQDVLMYPVPEIKTLRGSTPLGSVSGKTIVGPGVSDAVALFTDAGGGDHNTTTFDVEATIALPSSGAAVEFNVLLLASPADYAANFSYGAMVNVNVSAAVAGSTTRFVSMSTLIGGGPVNIHLWLTNLTTTNFSMPVPSNSIEVRILADNSMLEVFVAKGRGVITQSVKYRGGAHGGLGGKGVYFMGGKQGPTTIMEATAWDMGWEPCSSPL